MPWIFFKNAAGISASAMVASCFQYFQIKPMLDTLVPFILALLFASDGATKEGWLVQDIGSWAQTLERQ